MTHTLAFVKNFETAFVQKIAATVRFIEMFANCRIFVSINALEKVSVYVTDFICIAQITREIKNNSLLIYNKWLDFLR